MKKLMKLYKTVIVKYRALSYHYYREIYHIYESKKNSDMITL